MKRKEIQELKTKPLPELQKLLKESTEQLRVLKFDLAAGKVKNVRDLRQLRKDIARMLTFINSLKGRPPRGGRSRPASQEAASNGINQRRDSNE